MAQESWKREQSATGCKQTDRTSLCINDCGFFGSPTTMNMCSECFNDHVTKSVQAASASPSTNSSSPTSTTPSPSSIPPAARALETAKLTAVPDQGINGGEGVVGEEKGCLREGAFPCPSGARLRACAVTGAAAPSAEVAQDPAVGGMLQGRVDSHCSPDHVLQIPASSSTSSSAAPAAPPSSSRAIRCASCKRRVGLTGFKCRCGGVFCATHRYSDKHPCPYDFKAAGREAIAKANPVVKADKVVKF